MGRRAIVYLLANVAGLAGCSFVDDFDKFKVADDVEAQPDAGGDATGQTREDAATTRDATLDATATDDSGPFTMIDSSIADAAVDVYVPPPACGGSVCDDGDPCTSGACEGTTCVYKLIDADGDGYSPFVCKPGSSAKGGDCNDTDKAVYPGATEVCDDVDNDCDGTKDDGFTKRQCYPDADRDGFANLDGVPVAACAACPALTLEVTTPTDRSKHDCWDDPADHGEDAYPGQKGYFEVGYGPGSKAERKWDYDCSGQIEPQYEVLASCPGVLGLICDGAMGFDGQAPACGESGKFTMCRVNVVNCIGSTDTKKQACH